MKTVIAIVVALCAVFVSAAETVLHVLITRTDENVYSVVIDPTFHKERPTTIFVRTERCHSAAENEAAIITGTQQPDKAWIAFASGDICEIVKAAPDRGSL
jgi:hypothetical protein